ncbi:MAG: 4-hydroxy-tetrahydrodipicolinate reductase [Rikenellaceae bacterium]
MNIAIIGYGKMGREIEKILIERGHTIAAIIDVDNRDDLKSEAFAAADVAIEFTTPHTAFDNLVASLEAGVAVVSGTTGWLDRFDEIKNLCQERNGAFFYASNYSLGVNLMFRLNRQLAAMINSVEGYKVEIEETHHIHKLDAPSGTAITLAEGVIDNLDSKSGWVNDTPPAADQVEIKSKRIGETPGIHTVTYDSAEDTLEIKHTIKSRSALAMGAVVAAEFLCGKQGIYSMDDLLK